MHCILVLFSISVSARSSIARGLRNYNHIKRYSLEGYRRINWAWHDSITDGRHVVRLILEMIYTGKRSIRSFLIATSYATRLRFGETVIQKFLPSFLLRLIARCIISGGRPKGKPCWGELIGFIGRPRLGTWKIIEKWNLSLSRTRGNIAIVSM